MADTDFEETPSPSKDDSLEDQTIHCMDCRESFVWSAGEQAFYRTKGLSNPPKRCKSCKKEKNKRLDAIEEARATGKRYRMDILAECARCKKMTTIPFYPSQGRPVYCRACYLELNAQATANEANA
ncbi:MAG TPA: zinc-ribbon domain containing protein [Pyrinomonadaceae bacterium]|jgi:CxxC-x17-CxxC domain-containing protein|nr:zinc-ribbon domain containing protein [Pyrinomonadaceae bacterium]